jgi:uncharacterized membrane protein YdbT with pleckstrin-like domain
MTPRRRSSTLLAVVREPGEQILFCGHPSWLSLMRLYVKGLVAGLVVGVAAGVASDLAVGRLRVMWVVLGVLLAFGLFALAGHLRRMKITYSVTSRRLAIETGLLSRRVHQTHLDHIQNVTARQSLVERALGIGTVFFDTAGELDGGFAFRGVDDPRFIARSVDYALRTRDAGARRAW